MYDNFGHTLVRVEDKKENRNYVFNWGVFSFGEPVSFAIDFYRGYLNYTLGISGYSSMLRMFAYDKRSVYEDKLFFTNKQKKYSLESFFGIKKVQIETIFISILMTIVLLGLGLCEFGFGRLF